jgi:hypothetical protein
MALVSQGIQKLTWQFGKIMFMGFCLLNAKNSVLCILTVYYENLSTRQCFLRTRILKYYFITSVFMKTIPYIIGAILMVSTTPVQADGYSTLPLTVYNTRPSTVRYTVPRTTTVRPVTTVAPVQEYTTTTVSTTPVIERLIERNTVQVVKQYVDRPVYVDRVVERPVYRDRIVTQVVERPVYVAPRVNYTRPTYTVNTGYKPYYSNSSYYPYSTGYNSNYSADYDYINGSYNTYNIDYTINSHNTGYTYPYNTANYTTPYVGKPYTNYGYSNYGSSSYGYSNYSSSNYGNSHYSSCGDSWGYLDGRC